MLCGRWESFPREFAKCRRCRKAKYCGKECQSTAWSEGHRFWCSAKDPEEDGEHHHTDTTTRNATVTPSTVATAAATAAAALGNTAPAPTAPRGQLLGRDPRRGGERERDRERDRIARGEGIRPDNRTPDINALMAVPGPLRDAALARMEMVGAALMGQGAHAGVHTWGALPFRRPARRENDPAVPAVAPSPVRARDERRHHRLMGAMLSDEQLPPDVRRHIMQARQDPADRGEGPSVGPARDATLLGDGSGDDMIIG